jgi:hypothetical protein
MTELYKGAKRRERIPFRVGWCVGAAKGLGAGRPERRRSRRGTGCRSVRPVRRNCASRQAACHPKSTDSNASVVVLASRSQCRERQLSAFAERRSRCGHIAGRASQKKCKQPSSSSPLRVRRPFNCHLSWGCQYAHTPPPSLRSGLSVLRHLPYACG